MAKPAFIYAFDNLGPERFTELCGLLLASRYKGFLLGGVGADGGVDGEIDTFYGTWQPEINSPLLNEIIKPNKLVVFQFKHKVTARVGQAQTRTQLLGLFKCQSGNKCELHRNLILKKNPNTYVLVTNTEVNSEFRAKFIDICKQENSKIENYQIIGLDELETWVTMEVELRHLYFPTIFGLPRFHLAVELGEEFAIPSNSWKELDLPRSTRLFQVAIKNMGVATSYINSIQFSAIVDGQQKSLFIVPGNPLMELMNPKPGTPLEPGRKHTYHYPLDILQKIEQQGKDVFPYEVVVFDEIGNQYSAPLSEELREFISSDKH